MYKKPYDHLLFFSTKGAKLKFFLNFPATLGTISFLEVFTKKFPRKPTHFSRGSMSKCLLLPINIGNGQEKSSLFGENIKKEEMESVTTIHFFSLFRLSFDL